MKNNQPLPKNMPIFIKEIIEYIQKNNIKFDSIACCGHSGVIPATIVSLFLNNS
jgi:hypoxanthine phosphoribosyltransferase